MGEPTMGRGETTPARDRADHGILPGVERIAVLRAGGLGDLLFAVPAIRALAAAYPDAEITLLGSRAAAEVFAGRRGGPHRVHVLPPIRGVGAAADALVDEGDVDRFAEGERRERYDIAVQLHGGGRYSNPFLRRLDAGCTIGTRTPDAEDLDRSIDYVYYQHEMVRGLEVAGLVGAVPVEVEARMELLESERERGLELAGGGRPVVVVHPGATDPRRRWPVERFAQVIGALVHDGARAILVGDAGEQELCGRVAASARFGIPESEGERVVDLSGGLGLSELVGVLGTADLVIGNDSGPRHLAQALGTRTASVYWFGNLINAGPLGRERHRAQISWTTRCPVCGRDCTQVGWTSERCEHDVSFVADVLAEPVIEDARRLLAAARG